MTLDTLVFLRGVLCSQVIEVGNPEFVALSAQVGRALAELDEMIAAVSVAPDATG